MSKQYIFEKIAFSIYNDGSHSVRDYSKVMQDVLSKYVNSTENFQIMDIQTLGDAEFFVVLVTLVRN